MRPFFFPVVCTNGYNRNMTDPNADRKRKETERASMGLALLGAITILYFVFSGDMDFNQKSLVVGLAVIAGVLLFVGFKLKKS